MSNKSVHSDDTDTLYEVKGRKNMSKVILVVDDDMMNRRMAEFMLKRKGYEMMTADSGAAGIACLQDKVPDLLLLDVEMPGMNGLETLAKIRENDAWKELPVVFLTGDFDEETIASAEKLGALDYIKKPFIPQDLQQRVEKIIG